MNSRLYLPALLVSIILTGCQTTPPAPVPQMSIKCGIPSITTLPETKEAQEKGGLEIAVVPSIYKAVRKDRTITTQAQPPIGLAFIPVVANNNQQRVYVEQVTTPSLKAEPARLQFRVRVNNKLARVFRGQGSVVQFNVGGKLIPFNNIDYKEFLNGIVPPRNETEFTIYGPSLDLIGDKGTIGIFLYDVVTATDTAGNTTDKQNYEWYFAYETKTVEEMAEHKRRAGFMEMSEFQRVMTQQRLQEKPEQK